MAFPILVPVLDDNRRSALWMKVCPVFGLDDGVAGGVSSVFLKSLAAGETAAPNAFAKSDLGLLGGDLAEGG